MNAETEMLLRKAFPQVRFTEDSWASFSGWWHERAFPRHHLITEAGSSERYLYLVLDGVQALYVIDRRGEKVVLAFSYAGDLSGVYDAFLERKPSEYFLEALTPTRMLALPREQYDHLFELSRDFDLWGREFHAGILIGRVQREIELLTRSAEERYLAFMNRCPEPLLQVPQKYLASYLNMTPETFSRMRKKQR